MWIEHFPSGPLGCNCTIIADESRGEALVVDPGGDADRILEKLSARGLRCVGLLHTHTHFDHVGATHDLQAATSAAVMLHEEDLFLYQGLQMQLDAFRIPFRAPKVADVDRFVRDGDTLRAGAIEGGIMHTPGHTPGSVCLTLPGVVIAGDTLFRESIGRTDLWGGDSDQILRSIEARLLTLPEDTVIITGHGPATTVGHELKANPFVGRSAR